MPKGSEIIVSANPQGKFLEGYVSGTPKPGTIMQIKAATAAVEGRFTWEAFNRNADGDFGICAVLLPDSLQGAPVDTAYVSGARCFLYVPLPGEEMNVLKLDVAGTADDFAIGDYLMVDDGTGKVLATTGPTGAVWQPFICLETVTDPTADQLVYCMKS
jgi:hypothetical protein